MAGAICSAGFESGDRFVVGHWDRSPLGPMADVMWARPDGRRVLLVPDSDVGAFVSATYRFDEVVVVPFDVQRQPGRLSLQAGELRLELVGGRARRLPPGRWRSPWFTRWVEGPVARPLLGVRTFGVSPTGVLEWYRADEYRPVVIGHAGLGERDLGRLRPLAPALGVGFSEPPRRPSMVLVRPRLLDPSGRLDRVVDGLVGRRSPSGGEMTGL